MFEARDCLPNRLADNSDCNQSRDLSGELQSYEKYLCDSEVIIILDLLIS